MGQYSVLHMIKLKDKDLAGISMHIDRHYREHNVEGSRIQSKEELSHYVGMELSEAVSNRIKEGYKKQVAIRQDAVRAIEVMLTGSHEQMKKIESEQELFNQWQEANYKFACEQFGERNIVRFSVHRYEKTPHIHCVFVPITKEGGLSAKSYMGGKDQLKLYQDQYGKVMEKFGLSRGLSLSKDMTEEVHISRSDYQRERSKDYQNGEMYKNLLKEAIDQDLEGVKQKVNLVKQVGSMGYTLDREKSCRSYAVMEKGDDKLVIKTSPNKQGHWVYMSVTDMYSSPKGGKDKGTIVDLMINRGYNFKEVRHLSSDHIDDSVWKQVSSEKRLFIPDEAIQTKLAQAHLLSVRAEGLENYLEKRGIDSSIYSRYQGNGLEVGREAVFGLYLGLDEEGNGRLCSTITYYYEGGKSRQRCQYGLPRGLSVLRGEKNSNRVVIMESGVDALSLERLLGWNAIYICTCGNLGKQTKEELKRVIEGIKVNNKELWLSFDNDKEGKKMSQEVEKIARGIGVIARSMQPSIGKDWNEELMKRIQLETTQMKVENNTNETTQS